MLYETFSARAELEHAIAAAIDLLDLIDPDADYEETGDLEPSLGAYTGAPDLELECEDEGAEHDGREPDVDDEYSGDEKEPWLGSFDRMVNQEHSYRQTESGSWFAHEDRELDRSDSEPSLGSPAVSIGNQERWADGIDAEPNGDERDDDGDLGDGDRSDDDPIFPSLGAAVEHEAHEMRRVAAFIEGRCRRLIKLERQAVRS